MVRLHSSTKDGNQVLRWIVSSLAKYGLGNKESVVNFGNLLSSEGSVFYKKKKS